MKSLVWLDFVCAGGYFNGGIDGAFHFRSDHTFAYIFRIKVAFDTRPIICLSCSSISSNKFCRVTRIKWKCMFLFLRVLFWFLVWLNTQISSFLFGFDTSHHASGWKCKIVVLSVVPVLVYTLTHQPDIQIRLMYV